MRKVESVKELKKICQKSSNLYSFTDRGKGTPGHVVLHHHILDFFAIYIVKILLYTRITANQVTYFSLIVGMGAASLFGSTDLLSWVLASLLLQFYFVLDGVDGCIARYRKTANPIGKYYDIMAPALIIPAVIVGIAFYVYSITGFIASFLIAIVGITFFLLSALSNAHKNQLITDFIHKKNNPEIEKDLKGKPKYSFENGVPLGYAVKKLMNFHGASFMFIALTVLDYFFRPVPMIFMNTSFTFTWRTLSLFVLCVPPIFTFLGRVYRTAKLQKKVMKYL